MRVEGIIAGREGLPGVDWLLRGKPSRTLLRRVLKGMLREGEVLGGCSLTRAKFRSGHKLTACFDVALRAAKPAPARTRPVVVTWSKPDSKPDHKPESSGQKPGDAGRALQDEADRRGTSAPFRQLSAEVAGWNMRVEAAPFDRRFPQLIRLADPVYAGEIAGEASAPRVRWLRYRPGQRHVLRYEFPTRRGLVFVKLYRGQEAQGVYETATEIAERLADRGPGIASVRPLALLAGDSAVLFPQARGLPLRDFLERPNPWASETLERAGAALRLLQSLPHALAGSGQPRDFAAQAEATLRTSEHRAALLPAARCALEQLLDRAIRLDQRTPPQPHVFAHGDFKTDHVYVTNNQLTLIDFDSRCLADPGYDTGKFMADLQWQLSARGPDCVEEAQAHFLDGYAPSGGEFARIRLWEAVMLAHLGWRRLPLFLADSTGRLDYMLRCADRVLATLEEGCP